MESALRDMLTAMGIVTPNPTLTSICGSVEKSASLIPNNVKEPVQPEDMSAETTCASAKMMIPSVQLGITAKTTENVTEPAQEIGNLVTRPVSQDTTSATTPTATHTQMAPSTPTTVIFVHQQNTFQNTTNTAEIVTSVRGPDSSVHLMRAAPVQWSPRVSSPSS